MISICLPSRGRPGRVQVLVSSILETATLRAAFEIIVRVDDDDRSYDCWSYAKTRIIRGPRRDVMDYWNDCAAVAEGEILMHAGDDLIFRTVAWDRQVVRAFEQYDDRIVFVHGNDGSPVHGNGFGTHGFVHRRWVDALGYMVPPYFVSDGNDMWLNEIANRLGRRRYIPILTEHMHPSWGKGPLDRTHEERLERARQHDPMRRYRELLPERTRDREKLQALIGRAVPA